MTKTILVTGATDGIGLLTAQTLAEAGHTVLLHGRSAAKLEAAAQAVGGAPRTYQADMSDLDQVRKLAADVVAEHNQIDVLINNAGVYKTPNPILPNGQDLRFVVNTLAPHVLTYGVMPALAPDARIINLSSAAQAPVDINALKGTVHLDDFTAYAQSKLALTIWSQDIAKNIPTSMVSIAVNPGSLLASKMVKEGFGVAGNDLSIGAEILCRLALDEAFSNQSGAYWDNDAGRLSDPHPAAADKAHVSAVLDAIKSMV